MKARLTEWRGNADRKRQLATKLVQKYDAESSVRGRGEIADVLHADYKYADLTPDQRRSMAGWKAKDLLAVLDDDPIKAFQCWP